MKAFVYIQIITGSTLKGKLFIISDFELVINYWLRAKFFLIRHTHLLTNKAPLNQLGATIVQ